MTMIVGNTITQADINELNTAEARAHAAEERLHSTWYEEKLTRGDVFLFILVLLLVPLGLLAYIRISAGSNNFAQLNGLKIFSMMMSPLVGAIIALVGLTLTRMLNSRAAEWIGGSTTILGTVIFLLMVFNIKGEIQTAISPQNPTVEVDRSESAGEFFEIKITNLDLPTYDFDSVEIITQQRRTISAEEAKVISDASPMVMKVPREKGSIFYKVEGSTSSLATPY